MKHNVQEGAGVELAGGSVSAGWNADGHYIVGGVDLDYGDKVDALDWSYREAEYAGQTGQNMDPQSLDSRIVVASGDIAILHS